MKLSVRMDLTQRPEGVICRTWSRAVSRGTYRSAISLVGGLSEKNDIRLSATQNGLIASNNDHPLTFSVPLGKRLFSQGVKMIEIPKGTPKQDVSAVLLALAKQGPASAATVLKSVGAEMTIEDMRVPFKWEDLFTTMATYSYPIMAPKELREYITCRGSVLPALSARVLSDLLPRRSGGYMNADLAQALFFVQIHPYQHQIDMMEALNVINPDLRQAFKSV